MNFSISSPTQSFTQPIAPVPQSPPMSPEGRLAQIELDCEEEAENLTGAQRAQYLAKVRAHIADIRLEIVTMRSYRWSDDTIHGIVDDMTKSFYTSERTYFEEAEKYVENKSQFQGRNHGIQRELEQCNPDFSLMAPAPYVMVIPGSHERMDFDPLGDSNDHYLDDYYDDGYPTEADESVSGSMQTFLQAKSMERVATARIAAGAIEGVGAAVSYAVNAVCHANPTNEKVCKATAEFGAAAAQKVKEVGKDALSAVGALDGVKRVIHTKSTAYPERLQELGVPKDMAYQADADAKTLAMTCALFAGGGGGVQGGRLAAARITAAEAGPIASFTAVARNAANFVADGAEALRFPAVPAYALSAGGGRLATASLLGEAGSSSIATLARNISNFMKDEAGSVRLRKDFIKMFQSIDYEVVKGAGKGGHMKMRRPASPMVIIPSHNELATGTARNLLKIFKRAKEQQIKQ